jgi:hypothetical protein
LLIRGFSPINGWTLSSLSVVLLLAPFAKTLREMKVLSDPESNNTRSGFVLFDIPCIFLASINPIGLKCRFLKAFLFH